MRCRFCGMVPATENVKWPGPDVCPRCSDKPGIKTKTNEQIVDQLNVSEVAAPGKTIFADLADMEEDRRIDIMAEVINSGKKVLVSVDDEPAKVARYIRKLQLKVSGLVIVRVAPIVVGAASFNAYKK